MTERNTRKFRRIQRRWLSPCSVFILIFLVTISVRCLQAGELPSADNANAPFRFGFASSMLTEVNENDARAAMKVWIQGLSREWGIPVDAEVSVFNGVEGISHEVRSSIVSAVALTTE